jgi:hypothetical protein
MSPSVESARSPARERSQGAGGTPCEGKGDNGVSHCDWWGCR